MYVLTWADSDGAELGLFCRATTWLAPILRLLAGACSVTITSTTCGGAQAPGSPIHPGTINYMWINPVRCQMMMVYFVQNVHSSDFKLMCMNHLLLSTGIFSKFSTGWAIAPHYLSDRATVTVQILGKSVIVWISASLNFSESTSVPLWFIMYKRIMDFNIWHACV